MEAVSSMRSLPTFDCLPWETSHPTGTLLVVRQSKEVCEIVRPEKSRRSRERNHERSTGGNAQQTIQARQATSRWACELCDCAHTPITAAPKPHNGHKCGEYHEQNRYTTTECRELKKGLHELAEKGEDPDPFVRPATWPAKNLRRRNAPPR
ncbi:hypothetical protein Cgig2_020174 [Carnegiea gigantea]|uniref:Uncharacterized protein n=1 Tax=Carnegiea gigantea TaxID=171969 RepID=A0A9Q1QQ80_9CARY|nr:hypothetical protein Cgig2_020174 [Carnegiea gigantea]